MPNNRRGGGENAVGIGLFPDVGGSFFLPKLPGAFGMYLALTGSRLRGEDVAKAGVATHYIGSDKVAEVEDRLATIEIPSKDTVAAVLDEYDARSTEPPSWAAELTAIDRCFGGDSVEAIIDRLEADGSEWAAKQIKTLRKMSPTSLKLTHEQLTRGKQMSLEDCFQMEYRLTQGCMRGVDFYEGIRAVLIDKDHKPIWSPSSLHAVRMPLSFPKVLSSRREGARSVVRFWRPRRCSHTLCRASRQPPSSYTMACPLIVTCAGSHDTAGDGGGGSRALHPG